MSQMLLMVGTTKGTFLLRSDEKRTHWTVSGPYCENWPIRHVNYDPATRAIYAAGGSDWYGPAVWKSTDMGETWSHSSQGITYGDDGPKINTLWNITPAHGSLYLGADPAGLFRSDDGGQSWVHVEGLTNHPTRPEWMPGGGGLCLHTIVPHPTDPKLMWVGASSVGVFYTQDGGESWVARTKGLRADYLPPEKEHEIGFCVHKMAMAAGMPNRIYQQNHQGVYRSDDAGQTWEWINEGLPTTFGFPIAAHPHDPETAYVIPLSGDSKGRYMIDGKAAVWRTRDAGRNWQRLSRGLPQQGAFVGVLREAMSVDTLPAAGIYFGTSTGQVFVSPDEGENWLQAADFLPPISSVEAVVID